ncbi:C-C motif chemokine ligand 24 [Ictidomys tridecemlineatus]|uniref:C-C motif chemokine n=1 Tax=Ictidomys tridecemlineatus TaxID=43179 RepID=I3M580_ICTTR|nr:C-C motif chemokine 24 [Ictidomys tridecemlineatus]KAG3259821.1 C-C motif chemokine ligand 24 [Ictidomys tridecemlineatus]
MAGPSSIIAGFLLLALCVQCIIPTGSVVTPFSCCFNFTAKKIPQKRVVSYQLTSGSTCVQAGVIFTTTAGRKVCADPSQLWVQEYKKNLDSKQKQPSAEARVRGVKVRRPRHRGNRTAI